MPPNYCEKCGVEGIPDPQAKNQWECPRCHGKLIHVEAKDSLIIRDAFGMHGFSDRNLNGLPTREFARTVGLDGEASATEVERLGSRQSKIQRSMHPTGPSPRDSKGNRKRHEEIRAVTAMLVEYNRLHGTAYNLVAPGDDARGVDVIVWSQSPGEAPLNFQVTFVDTEGRLRVSISEGEPYSAEGSEEDLLNLNRFDDALRNKLRKPDPASVLVLNGAGIVTPAGTIERFMREHHHDLEGAPFREVWYVDQTPGGVICRLSPNDPASDAGGDGSLSPSLPTISPLFDCSR